MADEEDRQSPLEAFGEQMRGLDVRTQNALWFAGVRTSAKLATMSDWQLLRIRHIGRKTLRRIRQWQGKAATKPIDPDTHVHSGIELGFD